MTGRWLEEALAACRLPPAAAFPRNLAKEIPLSLPLTLVPLPHLSCAQVRGWLSQRKMHVEVAANDRRLRGCLVARKGWGVLFYNSEDHEHEQRFTLAHEVSHFVLDHLLPRARALRAFGRGIRPVLDGDRHATREEDLSAVLDRTPLKKQVELMARDACGSICAGKVAEAEQRADRLACELLAPAALTLETLRGMPRQGAIARVASRFGLPMPTARAYARMLLGPEQTPRLSIRDLVAEGGR